MSYQLLSSTLQILPRSLASSVEAEYGLAQTAAGLRLVILALPEWAALANFEGERSEFGGRRLLTGPLSPHNAAALRSQLPWLRPQPLGLHTSAGMGDRMGLATPGHVRGSTQHGRENCPHFCPAIYP